VDDGAPTIDDALEGVGRMVEAGVSTIVTTPHLEGWLTRDGERLRERLRELDQSFAAVADAVAESFPNVRFERGCEVSLDRPDLDFSNSSLRLAGTSFVLVEWPRLRIPPWTPAVVRSIRAKGIFPLIAHPERYVGYDDALSVVAQWKEEGAYLQMNYGSLAGRYGSQVRARAFRLLEAGAIDCLSTDFHGRPSLGLFINEAFEIFERLEAASAWELLTRTNPQRIARGEPPVVVPPVEGGRSILARLRSLFTD
jgi:protein-tyrosine phosphatase